MRRRYRVIEYCDVPDCRCLDRAGVILYDGPDPAEARRQEARSGYRLEILVEPVEAGAGEDI